MKITGLNKSITFLNEYLVCECSQINRLGALIPTPYKYLTHMTMHCPLELNLLNIALNLWYN